MHAPLAFLIAAAAMGFTAAAFAELGTRMPVSASEAAYVEAAFHRKWLTLGMGLCQVNPRWLNPSMQPPWQVLRRMH